MKPLLRLLLLALSAAGVAHADVTLAPLFTDHAVLQRDRAAPVWGTAAPGESVTVRFAGQAVTAIAGGDGRWSVRLQPLPAHATGQTLTVAGTNTIVLSDILVGDVWLCGGQSNMEWALRQAANAEAEIAAADHPLIRHIKIQRRIARDPITTAEGEWVVCTPETARHFTAVGYFFARDVQRELGVPVGLVNSTWGGTPAEAWLPPAAMNDLDLLVASASHQARSYQGIHEGLARYQSRLATWKEGHGAGPKPTMPWRPGAENTSLVLNNGMIAPLVPYALRGVIWYQGEANADQPETYREIFGGVIAAWRDQFQQPDLPFYWVQLANWDPDHANGASWAFLREAQTQTLALPHTGQAVTIDIGNTDDIHPTNKQDVGARLARLTLARDFGRDLEDTGPTFAAANVTGGAMVVSFDHAAGLTTTDGAAPLAFELAGPDKVFHPATAELDGNQVTISAPDVPQPLYVRYAWHDSPPVNLVNSAGLPAVPFRTDRD
jgi:sialate O-acetylesterase